MPFSTLGHADSELPVGRTKGDTLNDAQDMTARIIRTLAGEGRIGEAVDFARAKLAAGDEWAAAWVPRIQAADRDQVSHVYTDTARYFGDNPPNDAETELRPTGTAITDLALTVGIVNDLAARWNAVDVPRPHPNGSHLAITVPVRTE